MKNEQNIIVTFSCNDNIHHYKGIRGVKPLCSYVNRYVKRDKII